MFGYRYGEVPLPKIEKIKEGVKIKKNRVQVEPTRRPVVLSSLGCHVQGHALPHPCPADPDTLEAGVRKRFCFEPPRANRATMRRFRRFVGEWCQKNLTPLVPSTDLSVEHWLDQCIYPLHRKEELRSKWKEVVNPLDEKYFKCKSFMKDETYTAFKHARAINSRTDEFKCLFGPVIKAIEKVIYANPSFIKHVPVKDRARYLRDRIYRVGGKYIATDYTAFESLFVKELMEAAEFVMFRHMTQFLGDGQMFNSICENVLAGLNKCIFKFFTVTVPATRMSGEMSTSLFNGFANLMIMEFMCKEIGTTCIGCVEGDDGLFRLEGPTPTQDQVRSLGLVIKMEEHYDICSASFCGLIFDPEDCVNVTDPLEILASFGWTTNLYHRARKNIKLKLLRCKSLSYAHQYPGCPIVQELAAYGLRMTRSMDIRHFAREQWRTSGWEREQLVNVIEERVPYIKVPMNTRLLVEAKFGIPVETQIQIEQYLAGLNELSALDIPLFDLMTPPAWRDYWSKYVTTKWDQGERIPPIPKYSGFAKEF